MGRRAERADRRHDLRRREHVRPEQRSRDQLHERRHGAGTAQQLRPGRGRPDRLRPGLRAEQPERAGDHVRVEQRRPVGDPGHAPKRRERHLRRRHLQRCRVRCRQRPWADERGLRRRDHRRPDRRLGPRDVLRHGLRRVRDRRLHGDPAGRRHLRALRLRHHLRRWRRRRRWWWRRRTSGSEHAGLRHDQQHRDQRDSRNRRNRRSGGGRDDQRRLRRLPSERLPGLHRLHRRGLGGRCRVRRVASRTTARQGRPARASSIWGPLRPRLGSTGSSASTSGTSIAASPGSQQTRTATRRSARSSSALHWS